MPLVISESAEVLQRLTDSANSADPDPDPDQTAAESQSGTTLFAIPISIS